MEVQNSETGVPFNPNHSISPILTKQFFCFSVYKTLADNKML